MTEKRVRFSLLPLMSDSQVLNNKSSAEEILKDDHQRYFVKDPENFSAARNKSIIEKTIEDYEEMRRKKAQEKVEKYGERADAVISYLKSIDSGKNVGSMEKYFGKRYLAYLRGQAIRDQLMAGLTIKNNRGGIIKPGS